MGTAFIFMLGGIYAIEVKEVVKVPFSEWSEEMKAHVLMGGLAMGMFGLQLCISPFRMWLVPYRIINIIFHFLIGMMNYVLGSNIANYFFQI